MVKQPAYSDPGKPGFRAPKDNACPGAAHLPSADPGCPEQGYPERTFMREVGRHRQEQHPAGLPTAQGEGL